MFKSKTYKKPFFTRMLNKNLAYALAAFLMAAAAAAPAFSYEFEDRIGMPTDALYGSIFTRNMSMVSIDKAVIDLVQVKGKREVSAIGDPGTGNQDNFKYTIKEKDEAIGFLLPLGGASFGADTHLTTKDLDVSVLRRGQIVSETFRERTWRAHFLVDLTQHTHAGFSYRFLKVENDIYGDFFLSNEDKTDYLGELSGYMANFYSRETDFGWGGYYAPAMRGKSEIEGEQKILTSPGTAGLNFIYYAQKKWTLGVEATRWFYKTDDRDDLSTSPIDQRTISLSGLDLEQRLWNTQRMSIGFDYLVKKDFKIRANFYRQTAAWVFRADRVPFDDPEAETVMTYDGWKLALNYNQKQFYLQAGIMQSERALSTFQDTRQDGSWFGHRIFGDYKAKDNYTFLGLGFEQ